MSDEENDPLTETPEEKEPVISKPAENSQPENEEASGFADFLNRLRNSSAGGIVTRMTASILTVVVVVVLVFAISRFYLNNVETAPSADEATQVSLQGGQGGKDDTTNIEEVVLPEYQISDRTYDYGDGSVERSAYPNTEIPSRPRSDVDTYVVQEGDSVFSIAEQFDLKPETILWGNYDTLRDNPRFLAIGQILNILPTDGIYYRYSAGENLNSIAVSFGVSVDAIVGYPGNHMDPYDTDPEDPGLADGTMLIIPGGERELADWGPPSISRTNPAVASYYGSGSCGEVYEGPIGDGIFIWPTPATYLSGYHFNASVHPGIDIGGTEGNAVWASDTGVVVYAGWSEYGYGNLIVIDHGNGWQTAYAHLQNVQVSCGQAVYRGDQIGTLGTTGNSTGPHLHFEMKNNVYGKVNPMDYLQ